MMLKHILIAWFPLIALLAVWVGAAFYFGRRAQKIPQPNATELNGPSEAITLFRKAEAANIIRRYHVKVDDQRVGSIKVGEVLHLPVTSGEHTLTIQIDWCRSHPLTVTKVPGKNLLLECGASSQDWRCLFTIFARPRDYVYIAYPA